MQNIPFYKHKPTNNELVLAIFEKENDSYFEGKLLEYDSKIFLRKEDATRKKRVTSWNKIISLNKEMIVVVNNLDFGNDTIQVSIIYEEQEKFLENCKNNKKLISIIKSVAFYTDIPINDIWSSIIYVIDDKRRGEEYDEEIPTILQYCIDNMKELKEFFKDKPIFLKIEEMINKFMEEKVFKIESSIGIISYGGIENTKKLIDKSLMNISCKYSLTYGYYKKGQKSFPAYIFETSSEDSNADNHENFIKCLESNANNELIVKAFEKSKIKI